MDLGYKCSQTRLIATWVKDHIWSFWSCSNCGNTREPDSTSLHLPEYCSRCGAKMTNPGWHFSN